jgi:hypothetical protein
MAKGDNHLIRVSPGAQNRTWIHVRIQFVIDVAAEKDELTYIDSTGTTKTDVGMYFVNRIYNEVLKSWGLALSNTTTQGQCFGYVVEMNQSSAPILVFPSKTTPTDDNCRRYRDKDTWGNPFAPGAKIPDPVDNLPLIRFYIGEGASLTSDLKGNLAQALPGYAYLLASKTSFSTPQPLAFSASGAPLTPSAFGYLFTNTNDPPERVFVHELGHILGLKDRYINGIDLDSTTGQYVRRTAPLSISQIDQLLGASGSDPDYKPQQNLMGGTRSYKLSKYQLSIIKNQDVELDYIPDNVIVLLFKNAACRNAPSRPVTTGCLIEESNYLPTGLNANKQLIYEKPNTTPDPLHDAYFMNSDPDVYNLKYQGNKATVDYIWMYTQSGFKSAIMEMVYNYLTHK